VTQVYRPAKVPRIAAEHLLGLWKLKRELDGSKNENAARLESSPPASA